MAGNNLIIQLLGSGAITFRIICFVSFECKFYDSLLYLLDFRNFNWLIFARPSRENANTKLTFPELRKKIPFFPSAF